MKQSDNLFDGKFTYLDAVKIALLIVTAFSTLNVVDIMTPDGSWAWVRKLAAVAVVEGAFLGFEYATADAKSKRQVRWATIGFFCSLIVISLFAGLSGLLEFGGADLMRQEAGIWLGLFWLVSDVVQASALLTLVLWIAALASIYRFYSLADPDKKAELEGIELHESVTIEANNAMRVALGNAKPLIASARAVANVRRLYADELTKEQMDDLLADVAESLRVNYSVKADTSVVRESPVHNPSVAQQLIDKAKHKIIEVLTPASPVPVAADPASHPFKLNQADTDLSPALSEVGDKPTPFQPGE